jgi:hypothetical protein
MQEGRGSGLPQQQACSRLQQSTLDAFVLRKPRPHEARPRSASAPAGDRSHSPERTTSDADRACSSRRHHGAYTTGNTTSVVRSHSASALGSDRSASCKPNPCFQDAVDSLPFDASLFDNMEHCDHDFCDGESIPRSFAVDTMACGGDAGAVLAFSQSLCSEQVLPPESINATVAHVPWVQEFQGLPPGRGGLLCKGAEGQQALHATGSTAGSLRNTSHLRSPLVTERSILTASAPCMPVSSPRDEISDLGIPGGLTRDEGSHVLSEMDVDSAAADLNSSACGSCLRNSTGSSKKQQRTPVQKKGVSVRKARSGRAVARTRASSHPFNRRWGQHEEAAENSGWPGTQ